MTDKTHIYVIEPAEPGSNVIIKEKEGVNKQGDPKQQRISKFSSPYSAMKYLKEKFGIKS
jgi:hypothetical protein